MFKRIILKLMGEDCCSACGEKQHLASYTVTQHSAYPEDDPEKGPPFPLRFKLAQEMRLCTWCYHRRFNRRLYDVLPL